MAAVLFFGYYLLISGFVSVVAKCTTLFSDAKEDKTKINNSMVNLI